MARLQEPSPFDPHWYRMLSLFALSLSLSLCVCISWIWLFEIDEQRQARKALKEDFNILMHSNSNKLTDRFVSLYQAQEAMKRIYETAKAKCCEAEKEKNGEPKTNELGHSDIGSLSSDCSIPKHSMKSSLSPGFVTLKPLFWSYIFQCHFGWNIDSFLCFATDSMTLRIV